MIVTTFDGFTGTVEEFELHCLRNDLRQAQDEAKMYEDACHAWRRRATKLHNQLYPHRPKRNRNI